MLICAGETSGPDAINVPVARPAHVRCRSTTPHGRTSLRLPGARYADGRGMYYSLAVRWRTNCTDLRLSRLRLHDLRHTAASPAVMGGKNLPQGGKLLGHRHHRTTAGYAQFADAHLPEAAEKE